MSLPAGEGKRTSGPPDGTGPDSRRKGQGPESTAGGRAGRIGRKAGEQRGREGALPVRADLQTRQNAGMKNGPRRALIEPSGFSICEKWEAAYTRRVHDRRQMKEGAPRRDAPRGAPAPEPAKTGRAPSTGQRRPALPRADPAVPSALGGLASGFGMGPGVPRPPWPLTGGRRSSVDDENASHVKGWFPRALGAAQRAQRIYPSSS